MGRGDRFRERHLETTSLHDPVKLGIDVAYDGARDAFGGEQLRDGDSHSREIPWIADEANADPHAYVPRKGCVAYWELSIDLGCGSLHPRRLHPVINRLGRQRQLNSESAEAS